MQGIKMKEVMDRKSWQSNDESWQLSMGNFRKWRLKNLVTRLNEEEPKDENSGTTRKTNILYIRYWMINYNLYTYNLSKFGRYS